MTPKFDKEILNERVAFSISPRLRAELEAEAWEEQRTLSDYVRRLLESRGKFARTVGRAGGYAIGPVEEPKTEDDAGEAT